MDDESNNSDEVESHEQDGSDSGEKTFTQSELDQILARERARYQRKVDKALAASQPKKQERAEQESKHDPDPEISSVRQEIAELRKVLEHSQAQAEQLRVERDISKATSGLELTPDDMEILRAEYQRTGKIEHVQTLAKRMADTVVPDAAAKGFNEPGNGVNARVGDLPPNIADLTKDDIARLQSEGRLREVVERAHNVGGGAVFRPKQFGSKRQ